MKPHEERVVAEKEALDEKLAKLKDFCASNGTIFRLLEPEDQKLLRDQHVVMSQYSEILGKRISRFNTK